MSIRSPRGITANPQASPPAAVHNLRDRNSRRLNSKVYQPKRKPRLKGLKVLLEEPPVRKLRNESFQSPSSSKVYQNIPPPLPLHGPPAHLEVSTLHEPHKLHKEISGQKSSNGARPQRPPAKGFDDYKLETEFHDDHVILKTYQWEFESSTRICEESKWKRLWVIGAGATGEIWLEEEQKLGRFRAVKQLRRRLKADFTRELLAFVKLREHPHLFVQFLGWYENRENIFLAMEYIRHGNLAEYIRSQSKSMVIEANEITKQILEGLKVLHAKGICHRDLKPENVLMASVHPIWIKIADFGISKRTKDTFLRTRCGTDGYLAPELLGIFPGQETYTHALDIWSLGSMVYEMCTSLKPFHHLEGGAGTDATIYTGLEESIKQSVLDMTSLIEYCKGVKDFPSQALEASGISREGMILIKSLLTPAPEGRATADSALESPWL
ncbi:kinase-like domain-containing protein, partial [Morchella snyderi]